MGKDGPLSIKFEGVSIASDNSVVEIAVAFPGQTGFCGGWYSPLMLFFDDARPTFMGSSAFRLSAASHTYWVEAGAPGYFLAIDRNNNGKIDNKDELFGDLDNDKNGFDALKALDSNNDGVVNAKDKKNFKRLLLWQDKNGDGLSTKEELNSAKDFGVSEIELKHQRVLNSYGQTAAARQVGRFTFSKNNEFKTGKVEDIWLAPMNKEQPK